MKHLESTFAGNNSLWKYIVMFATILIVVNTIGSLPLIVAVFLGAHSNPVILSHFSAHPGDFSVLNIDPVVFLIIMVVPFITGLVTFIILVKPLNNRAFKSIINGTDKIRWSRFFISGLIWLLLSAVYLFVYLRVDPSNFSLNNTSSSLIFLSVVSIALIPFQAAFEEVLFRGYLMQGFAVLIRNRWFPLIMTSILFGLMHALNPEVKEFGFLNMMPQYMLFGLIFGIITLLDDGIEAAMGAHAANNVFLCIMVTNRASALQTPALYQQYNVAPWIEFAGLLVTGVIFIFILTKIFRLKNFSILFQKIVC